MLLIHIILKCIITKKLKELNKEGIETEIFWIGLKPISGCIACGR